MRGRSASGGSLRWNDPDRFHGYDLSRVAAAPQAVNNHDGHSRTIAQERWRRPLPRRIIGQPPNHARPRHRAGSIARAAPPLEDHVMLGSMEGTRAPGQQELNAW